MPFDITPRVTTLKCLVAAATAVVALVSAPAPAAEDDAAVIRRQSQEFSDASASGDAAVLARYLDDRVIFMNEGGDMATKKDIVDGAQPSPKGTSNTLKQADLKVELHGNVAVTSFADLSTVQFHGQTLHAKYLSTEVWLREAGGWKMISSQTMAAQDDPPAVTLPAKVLDEIRRPLRRSRFRLYLRDRAPRRRTERIGERQQARRAQGRAARRLLCGGAAACTADFPARCERPYFRFRQPPRRARHRAQARELKSKRQLASIALRLRPCRAYAQGERTHTTVRVERSSRSEQSRNVNGSVETFN